jgi:N6-adenosine-specific RNA methylase IME4
MAKKNFKEAGVSAFLSEVPEPVSVDTEVKDLKINPIFQALIPPLSAEEYAQLEENLIENGIREAISIWGDTIIDGHNRFTIATKHGLPYKTVSYEFTNEDDVKLWIFKNQIGRRNLPPHQRVILALSLKPVIAEKAKEQQVRKSANSVSQISAEQTPIDTRKVIADMAGVSHDTVSKVEKIIDVGIPETVDKLNRGDISIHKAYQYARAQEKKTSVDAPTEQPILFTNLLNKYTVIYADCPWESELSENDNNPATIYFPSVGISELKKLVIPAADDAILLIWSTAPTLEKALQVMNAWGFKYRTNIIWDKQFKTNQWIHGQHEILLLGVKGKFSLPVEGVSISSVYREKRSKHSLKPTYFYEQIEQLFPNERYLELFSQTKHNDLWEVWGNQLQQLPKSEGEEI